MVMGIGRTGRTLGAMHLRRGEPTPVKLPNRHIALVPREKVVGYLLSATHPVGQEKARFFRSLGFEARKWTELRDALLGQAAEGTATPMPAGAFGRKYLVRGILQGPRQSAAVLSVWIIPSGDNRPRFVTAYPETG
jgi:hypothetical protein